MSPSRANELLAQFTGQGDDDPMPHADAFDVLVERRAEIPGPLSVSARSSVEQEVERLIKGFIGVSTTVRVVEPGSVQRSQGKAVRVIDKRPKN